MAKALKNTQTYYSISKAVIMLALDLKSSFFLSAAKN